jgi:hypothetical protein
MADHWETWVRLREVARQRFRDEDLVAELTARELFDAKETAAYAAVLDAQAEEQGILDTARTVTRLKGELHEELWGKGFDADDNKEEYVHLDDDDLAYLELPTDEEAAESAAEQRALMVLFEMHHRDESGREKGSGGRAGGITIEGAPLGSPLQHGGSEEGKGSGGEASGGGGPGKGSGGGEGTRSPVSPSLLPRRCWHHRRCPTPPPVVA